MEHIDKLTLELLMNKTTYQKYVEKTDPKKYEEHRQYCHKIDVYHSRILNMTREYLENPDKQVTLDMNQAFFDYAKSCIRHFEEEEIQSSSPSQKEDILFGSLSESKMENKMPTRSKNATPYMMDEIFWKCKNMDEHEHEVEVEE
jgi:hypothetical protein